MSELFIENNTTLSAEEYEQLIYQWNDTARDYPQGKTINELFEEQAGKTPDNIALVYEGIQLTYKELNERSNQLAHYLRERYRQRTQQVLAPDTLIALCLDRSPEMVIGILAVLKAGAAYVPIDPAYPQERIAYILGDTQAAIVLSQRHICEDSSIELPKDKLIPIDFTEELYHAPTCSNLAKHNKGSDLAYVIYTSGTTGKPKGVMIEHSAALNTIHALAEVYRTENIKRSSAYTSYVFDVSVSEIFNSLLIGLELHILSNSIRRDSVALAAYLIGNKINLVYLPPVLLAQLPENIYPDLNTIIYAGEPCDKKTVKLWSGKVNLFNYYGPTEASIYATGKQLFSAEAEQIGKPVGNMKAYVLDNKNAPVAIGVIGELYLAGAGLARAYLNRPELTAERFISNPFASEGDETKGYSRLYKTGDLVKYLADGNMEYIGRNDEQVKIRGYRIEPGEIENALSQVPGIKQSCVVAKERKTTGGNIKYLVAYYIVDKNETLSSAIIQNKLAQVLPEYMLPDALIGMETFPLTINGKLDKRALPDPDFGSSLEEYVAPTREAEKKTCKIWEETLGLERVGIKDEFFRIGGNSILAIQAAHRMSKALNCEVKVADVFKHKTISQILIHSIGKTQLSIPKITSNQLALSFAQERLWFIEQFEEGTNAYHLPEVYELDIHTKLDGIKYALQQIISRHEVLRSTIEQGNTGNGIQVVHEAPLAIEEIIVNAAEDYQALIKEDMNRPFDLKNEYPIRVKIYTIESAENSVAKTLLLINTHHIASDGWSMGIFQKELPAYYEAYVNKDVTVDLPELKIQYKDYALWQRSYLSGEVLTKQLAYWKNKLAGYVSLEFPVDYARPNRINYKGGQEQITLNKEISKNIRALARQMGTTLQSVLLSSLNILLSKYTGQEDIVIGSPIANRQHWQTEGLIGFFVNTQVNRTLLSKTQSFTDLIQQVHQDQVEAQFHQDLPFEKLLNELNVERDVTRHPIFQVMFGVQNFGTTGTSQQNKYLQPHPLKNSYETERFDLSFLINDGQENLVVNIGYATSLFKASTITRLADHFTYLLTQLTKAPDQPYSKISLLNAQEYEQVVYAWNATSKVYPKDKTIQSLFQEQAQLIPDNIALVFEGKELSYKELNEKSNQLAHYIRKRYEEKTKRPLAPDTFIALYLDRSLEMVIAILAVLKAGAAYVPIDPAYPQSRIDYMLEDTQAELILTQEHLVNGKQLELPGTKVMLIDLKEDVYREEDISDLPVYNKATDLAYIIYTSGTTGRPKGVLVEHHQVISFAKENNFIAHKKTKTIAGVSNYAFDGSIFDLFYTFINGKQLVLIDKNCMLDITRLDAELIKLKVDTVFITTALFNSLVQHQAACLNILQQILFGGERCNLELINKFKNLYPHTTLIHVYGPTENIVYSTSCNLSIYPTNAVAPIGTQLSDKKLYVLNPDLSPVPIGLSGELYIGGAGVARGYLNRPDLTEERFVPNPFATEEDKLNNYTRLYKTGDLVRRLPDGNIEYLGRNDDQVKIRGHRIELAEIENVLAQLEGIEQACVLVKERATTTGNTKYIVAYYVTDNKKEKLTQAVIHDQLTQVLPEYMLPAALIAMETFPLTSNGKLDKRALPDPDFNSSADEYVAPTTEVEKVVCTIWEETLGLVKVGIMDEFFRIGGNSILAIQVAHRMTKALACEVKVADVFKYKNISQLLRHSLGKAQVNIVKTEATQAVLSFAQERLWFIEQYEEGTNAYHIPEVYELDVDADVEGLKYALQQIVSRHEVLRSTIEQGAQEGRGMQIVHDQAFCIEEIIVNKDEDFHTLIKAALNRPFDLRIEYPIRTKLYTLQSGKTFLVINIHHIASDGWSGEIFQKELSVYYEAYTNGDKAFNLPALEIQYKDYAVWQRSYLTDEILTKQLSYWKEKLAGYKSLEFPTDYARPAKVNYKGGQQTFTLNKEISEKIRTLAQTTGVTLHSLMLSSMHVLLNKYTGQEDIVTGSPIANRDHRQTEELIGFFVNTQVNRTQLSSTQRFSDLIQQVHRDQAEARFHQDLPFEKLIEDLGVERDPARHPVFQVMFGVQGFGNQNKKLTQQKKHFKAYPVEGIYEVEKFDLSVFIDDSQEELSGQITYATCLFREDTIKRFSGHYIYLLEQLTQSPQQAYSEFSLLNATEYKQIITDWNATDKVYSIDKTIHQLFEEQVIRTPDNIALVFEQQHLTYKEFNAKSNQLARYIRTQYEARTNQPLKADTLIVVCLERSLEMMIGIMAVLKAGAAYVPVDPAYPQERIAYILEDTKAEVILSQKHLAEKNIGLPAEKLIHMDLAEAVYAKEDDSNLQQYSCATDLAYIIYTSGTTGRPKGAMLPHSGIVNRLEWMQAMYPLSATDVVLQKTPYVFDVSVWEILWANWYGAKIVLAKPEGHKDSAYLTELIQREKVTSLHFVPSMLEAYNHYLQAQGIQFSSTIKYLFCSGEALHQHVVQQSYELSAEASFKLHNLYGPTEASIDVTYFETSADKNVYIGRPIHNTQVYVLDQNKRPVPVGVIGELYLGGAGLARGYLNRSDLTAERFAPNPFATEADKVKGYTRLYKTGDLVRWMPDGNIEYLGRNDDQVKIRGYRIELSEIENVLSQVPGIKQSCVLVKENKRDTGSTKYIVAYYIADNKNNGNGLTPIVIQNKLAQVLPEYMVPAALIAMETFPLTINGKLDKGALPDPDFSSSPDEYVAATTKAEKEACKIWEEILGLEQVGMKDEFFRIGGNSILAIQVAHRMSKALNCEVKVADVFKYKTITQLLTHKLGESQISIPRTNSDQAILSFAQESLWFIEQYEEGTNAYNMPQVYELDIHTKLDGIKYALQQIISRHEVLRSTIEQGDEQGSGIQVVHNRPLLIEEIKISAADNHEAMMREDMNRPFDLKNEYPIRVKFYTIKSAQSSKTLLLINTHHIASDGWSMGIFQKELLAYYEAYVNKEVTVDLPELKIQYKDYALWQRSYLTGKVLDKQLNYWKERLANYQNLAFPTDYVRPNKIDYKGAYQEFTFTRENSEKLRNLAKASGVALHSLMLSGLKVLLSKYTGQDDIIVGSAIANRQSQTNDLIGFFVNMQAHRTVLSPTQSFTDLIQQVHQDQVEAQANQDLPFEKLVNELNLERDTSRHPVFQVTFEVLNFTGQNKLTKQQKKYLKQHPVEEFFEVEKFDLSISIEDNQDELKGQISYATSLFHQDTITRFTRHYSYLLEQLVKAPDQPYSRFNLLSAKEYRQIIYDWNATDKELLQNKTIHQFIEEQAAKTPDHIALVVHEQELSYKILNEKSNQLARYIRKQYKEKTQQALTPDTLIALCLDRSAEMLIGILAVLKAGGAYVPMDPGYPQERIDYILKDTNAALVLSQKHLNESDAPHLPQDKVLLIDLIATFYKEEDTSDLPQYTRLSDLCYVVYTSGTTGHPKGVMVEQSGVINLIKDLLNQYRIGSSERFLLFSNYVFDAAAEQIYLSLFSGGTLYIIDNASIIDNNRFVNFVRNKGITHLDATPSYMSTVDASKLNGVKRLVLGAEFLPQAMFDQFKESIPVVINAYGPTEATITAIISINAATLNKASIQNTQVYILDANKQPVPIGVTGELYIGGAGLARGYLNLPDLTAQCFVDNPFVATTNKTKANSRLYKTGDLVKWLADGRMEYMGRNDTQVKIRGYRIELGEVENALARIEGIKQSCVVAKERTTTSTGINYLVAYYVRDHPALTQAVIYDQLMQVLPGYMVPDIFIEMESFPLTINGKLDTRALPESDLNKRKDEYVAPITETEKETCKIWQEILGLNQVGINDEFFRIGGNSILAIQVSHRMSRALECEVKVADLFKYKTISQLLDYSKGKTQVIIPKTNAGSAVLSFAQDRLWFIEQYEEGTNAYHMPEAYELDADTNVEGIKYALQQIVSRHEVLRSTIEQGDSHVQGMQVVHHDPLVIEETTVTAEIDVKPLIAKDINRPFNLSKEYPIRVNLYFIPTDQSLGLKQENKILLLITVHHIASDGWSSEVFQRELFAYYEAFVKKDTSFRLPDLEIQYKDYASWQRSYLTAETLAKQLSYWKEKLAAYQNLEIPTDYTRPAKIDYRGAGHTFKINKQLSQKLRALAQQYGVTLHAVMLSSINILLSKYTGQDDIVTGSPIANRHHRQTEGLIGFFVNTQVNRILVSKTQSYEDLIQQVHQQQIEAQQYQDLPFEKLVDELFVERDTSKHPVFQVWFIVQGFDNQSKFSAEQKKYLQPYQVDDVHGVEKFDLSIFIDDSQEELSGQITYATCLFREDTIKRFSGHYIYLLEQLTRFPQQAYSEFSLLTATEYKQIITDWNATDKAYSIDKTIHQLFEEQVIRTPDNIALVFEQQHLTYKEFNAKSNQLARYIRAQYEERTKQSLKADTLIVVCLERSLEMMIGIMAVLKAGAAYVPVDPAYPQERIAYILEDTKAEVILSQKHLSEKNIGWPAEKLIHIDLAEAVYAKEDDSNLEQYSCATDLAYIIYTSGTTGRPKGAMLPHSGIVNRLEWMQAMYPLSAADVVLQKTPYVFDVSVWEILWANWYGAKIVLAKPEGHKDSAYLTQLIQREKITSLHFVPSMLEAYNHYLQAQGIQFSSTIKYLFCSGEALHQHVVQQSYELSAEASFKLHNLYGPTEASIDVTYFETSAGKNVYIGRPIQNTQVYVLDASRKPVPVGVIGELYLGGAGLARGYLNRSDLTAERFVPHPFATEADKTKGYTRLYKTGDLVKWMPDGNIEYLGRNDDQVKIRGYRIELGEIETALVNMEGIQQSCVLAKERKMEAGGDKYLVAYYVLDNKHSSDDYADVLNSWESIYDSEYNKTVEEINIETDFSSWNSYITEEPVPLAEMEEWRDNIVDLIKGTQPASILEIGLGSGLLMYPLLNEVERYVGLDISQLVIDRHKKYLENKNYNTEFYHLKADQLDQLPADEYFDTVVINSVCQYFPNINYFEEVVDKAMKKLSAKGSVFLGDIRNYDLHKELIKEKLDFQGKKYSPQDIESIALKENELLISPAYFANLKNRYKNIKIEIFKRAGKYTNELSMYRYDVIISNQSKEITSSTGNIEGDTWNIISKEAAINHHNIPFLNQLSKENIRKHLSSVLPEYMVPSVLIAMESFPLTINGKLDRKALPDPDFNSLSEEYTAPTTEIEKDLCAIWTEVLGLTRVGLSDNFFSIGGNSILAIRVSHRMSALLNVDVKVADIFKYPTCSKLLAYANEKNSIMYVEGEL